MRIVASIEARMDSSRLPGKMMADIHGKPAIERVVERLERAERLDDMILATSVSPKDDILAEWAEGRGLAVFRGSEEDVLGRVVGAHESLGTDLVVEVTGDTPLLDPAIIDLAVAIFLDEDCDIVTTTVRRSYPDGIDAQVFPLALLAEVSRTVEDPDLREHVSLHFYRNPEIYRIHHLEAPPSLLRPELALLLDTPEDLETMNLIFGALEPVHGPLFTTTEILSFLDSRPDIIERCLLSAR